MQAVALRIEPPRRSLRLPLGRFAVSWVVFVALLSVGGVDFAASSVSGVVTRLEHRAPFFAKRALLVVRMRASAAAQYGTTTTSTTATTTTTPSSGSVTVAATPDTTGAITLTPPGDTTPVASILWTPATFTAPVTISANPAPRLPTGTTILGPTNTKVVSIVVTDSSGNVIHALPAPLEVVIPNPGEGFIPLVSEDGVNFRALSKLAGTTLPADAQDGYYVDTAGAFHILTRHLTIFAALYHANATISESGRKLAQPGSRKWGDPALIHPGAPVVTVVRGARRHGSKVAFRFYLDEQVSGWFWVQHAGKNLLLDGKTTAFRGHSVGGVNRRTLHLPILHLGTMWMSLATKRPLPSGSVVHFRFVDYDGHAVTKTLRIGR